MKGFVPLSDDPMAAILLTRASVVRALRADMSEARVAGIMHNLYEHADAAIAECFSASRAKPPCRKGCTLCCHLQVEVTVPEVLVVVQHLWSKPKRVREAVLTAARAAAGDAQVMDLHQRCAAKIPCPLLQEGACVVYAARPLACRRFFVADRRYCEAAFGVADSTVPLIAEPFILPAAAAAGVNLGLMDMGLFGGHVELVTALAAAPRDMFAAYVQGRVPGRVLDTGEELQQFVQQKGVF